MRFIPVVSSPPSTCLVTNVSSTSFASKCSPGFDGGLPQSFHAQVIQTNTGDILKNQVKEFIRIKLRTLISTYNFVSQTFPTPVFNFEDLPPGSPLTLVIRATNAKGGAREAVEIRLETRREERSSVVYSYSGER